MDLDLPPSLDLYASTDDFFFVQALQCNDELRLGLGPNHVDAPELPLAEWPSDFKVREGPFPSETVRQIQDALKNAAPGIKVYDELTQTSTSP